MASSPRPKKHPLLQRSRSGASRFCHVPSSPDHNQPPPLSPNLSLSRSRSRSKPSASAAAAAAVLRRAGTKENLHGAGAGAAAWPRPSWFSDGGAGAQRPRPAASAWALSPGRSPPRVPEAVGPRQKSVDGGSGGGGGSGAGGVLAGLFRRRRKEPSPKEEAAHQLRILAARLLQWRFANARAAAAMEVAESAADEKLFYAWVRVSELRKVVAAKQIMVQRRRQKLKLMRILNPQIQLLIRWEPLAKQHIEAVAVLGRVLGAACISLPLVEGAQANMVSLHRYFRVSMDFMKDVEANTEAFYSKVETTSSILRELEETIRSELEGLEQLMTLSKIITALEMHEISLRAQLIQAMEDDDDDDDDIAYLKY